MRRVVKFLQSLIRINSENPPGREREIAKFCYKFLKKFGYQPKIVEFSPRRSNLLSILKSRNSLKRILISPHLDTVPAGENWKIDPFSGKIINNKVYGRGASDCKGNLAVCLEVLAQFKEKKVSFQNLDIVFLASADEESGSKLGFKPMLDKIPKVDFGLILDGSEFKIIYAQKGLLHLRIKVLGRKAHGAYPERGKNAIVLANRVYWEIDNWVKRMNRKDRKAQFTLSIGKIQGGQKVNIVADTCFMELDIRFMEDKSKKELLEDLRKIIKRISKNYYLEVLAYQGPVKSSKNNFWLKALKASIRKEGIKPSFSVSRGATVLNFLLDKGIEGVVFGFSSQGQAHASNEYIAIPNLYKGVRILKDFLIKIDNSLR